MWFQKIKDAVIGKALDPHDRGVFHSISLIAFFAWVGLGADGLSSSCYGPEEAFLALQGHTYLSIFVALATAFTVFIISASYSQIIEVFPSGGGGYLVASKLLSPGIGMVSGCALIIDYLLTITLSIASGSDALFSFLPLDWHQYKVAFAVGALGLLIILNIRGVKESVLVLLPLFLLFVLTHLIIILYAISHHVSQSSAVIHSTIQDVATTTNTLGIWGMLLLIFRAYSLGAGTYTGIEAVSNSISNLREPKVKTGKKTMLYMSVSLAFTVFGLMLAYLFYNVHAVPGKTLNAVLFESIAKNWGNWGSVFVLVSLISEALILFVAAQTGFVGGPSVLANMAADRWFPTKFATLSDRLVTQNGILLFGAGSILLMILSKGSVKFLIILYSINVFITFCFSQLGMVRHWWQERQTVKKWKSKILINGVGLLASAFILVSVTVVKFEEGGWITLVVTGSLVGLAFFIKSQYKETLKLLKRLDTLVHSADLSVSERESAGNEIKLNPRAKTAVIMVNGFNGLGLHTLFNVIRYFGNEFQNFVFVEIGILDAGNFKGVHQVSALEEKVKHDVSRYVQFMRRQGYYAEGVTHVATDLIAEIDKLGAEIFQKFPNAVFFGGQLVFVNETIFTRWLHNFTVFEMQRRFYGQGIPFMILPIRV
ncbi:MAG: APC family permease [Candidatus Omnitrophica bacterium]|nr:APC family permease [Candidatus Omnitrophota bacterium]